MKRPTSEDVVKNVLTKIVKHISIIALIMSIIIMTVLYFGPEISLDFRFFTRLTVSSIILCISIVIIYELWSKSGQDKAKEEKDYIDLLSTFDTLSSNMDYSTMQEYLDYEEKRRYNVEYEKYSRLIQRDTELLKKIQEDISKRKTEASKLDLKKKTDKKKYRKLMHTSIEDRWKIKVLTRRIKSNSRKRTNIVIKLPYVKSEEFDYLRYNINSEGFKEYNPEDTKRYMRMHRTKKYVQTISLALFGVNMLSFGSAFGGNYWYALFMTILTIVTLIGAVVSGFSIGYKSISIVSTGVYKTANEYINKALVYCERHGKDLYYKDQPTDNEIQITDSSELESVVEYISENIEDITNEQEKEEKKIEIDIS